MRSLATTILFIFSINHCIQAQLQLQWNTVDPAISESAPILYSWQENDLSTHVFCKNDGNTSLYNSMIDADGEIDLSQILNYPDTLHMLSFKGHAYDNLDNIYVAGLAELGIEGTNEVVVKYSKDLIAKWEYFSPDSVSLINNAIHRSGDTTIVVSVCSVGMLFTSLHNSGQQVETNFIYTNKYFEFPDLVAYPQHRIIMGVVSDSSILVYVCSGHGYVFDNEAIEIEGFTGLIPMAIAYDDNENYYFELLGYDNEDSLSQIILQVNENASLNWMRSEALHKDDLYATLHANLYVDEDQTLISSTITQSNDDSVYIFISRYDTAGTLIKQRKLNATEWLDADLSATSAYRASTDMLYIYFPRMQTPDHAGVISMSCNSDWIQTDTLSVAYSDALAQCYAYAGKDNTLTLVNLKTETGLFNNIEVSQFTDTYVGIQPSNLPSPIEVYPNPCDAYVICDLSGLDPEDKTIVISDLAGRPVFALEHVTADKININTSQLPSGLYLLTVTGNAYSYTGSLVKR
jgi:hypothetical protein